MLKRKYAIAAMLSGMSVLAAGMPVSAAASGSCNFFSTNGACVVIGQFQNCNIPGFPALNLPDNGQTGSGLPESGLPDNGQTGGSLPESTLPDNGQTGSGLPESALPDNGQTDSSLPDGGQTGGGLPESTLPDDGQTDSSLAESNLPDNSAPESGTPETPEAPEEGEEDASPAMEVIALVNQERAKEGLPELVYDAAVAEAALVRAKETEISFSHTRPDGSSFSTALKEKGVSFRGAGENIAWGQKTPEQVMEAWMNSSGHRANIMNKNFTKIGVGYYQNSNGVNYWTQLFTY